MIVAHLQKHMVISLMFAYGKLECHAKRTAM